MRTLSVFNHAEIKSMYKSEVLEAAAAVCSGLLVTAEM